jgi:hypothetical protein
MEKVKLSKDEAIKLGGAVKIDSDYTDIVQAFKKVLGYNGKTTVDIVKLENKLKSVTEENAHDTADEDDSYFDQDIQKLEEKRGVPPTLLIGILAGWEKRGKTSSLNELSFWQKTNTPGAATIYNYLYRVMHQRLLHRKLQIALEIYATNGHKIPKRGVARCNLEDLPEVLDQEIDFVPKIAEIPGTKGNSLTLKNSIDQIWSKAPAKRQDEIVFERESTGLLNRDELSTGEMNANSLQVTSTHNMMDYHGLAFDKIKPMHLDPGNFKPTAEELQQAKDDWALIIKKNGGFIPREEDVGHLVQLPAYLQTYVALQLSGVIPQGDTLSFEASQDLYIRAVSQVKALEIQLNLMKINVQNLPVTQMEDYIKASEARLAQAKEFLKKKTSAFGAKLKGKIPALKYSQQYMKLYTANALISNNVDINTLPEHKLREYKRNETLCELYLLGGQYSAYGVKEWLNALEEVYIPDGLEDRLRQALEETRRQQDLDLYSYKKSGFPGQTKGQKKQNDQEENKQAKKAQGKKAKKQYKKNAAPTDPSPEAAEAPAKKKRGRQKKAVSSKPPAQAKRGRAQKRDAVKLDTDKRFSYSPLRNS